MRLVPMFNNILVRKDAEKTQMGSFYLPEAFREKVPTGTVVAAGPGFRTAKGDFIPNSIHVGDRVYFGKFAPVTVEWEGIQYAMLREDEVTGKIEEGDMGDGGADNIAVPPDTGS